MSSMRVEGMQLKKVLKLPSALRLEPMNKLDTTPPPPGADTSLPVLIAVVVSKLWTGIAVIKKLKMFGIAKVENAKFGNGVGVGAGINTLQVSGNANDIENI